MVKALLYSYNGYTGTEDFLKYCSFVVIKNVIENLSDEARMKRIGFIGNEWRYPMAEIELDDFEVHSDFILARDNAGRLWKKEKNSLCWFLVKVSSYKLEGFPYLDVASCKRFVHAHRNIFDKSTRRYVISSLPVVIKEVSTSPDGQKNYWFWVFRSNYYAVIEFDGKPSRREIAEAINKSYTEEFND